MTTSFLSRNSQFEFVFGVEKSQVELSVWLEMLWVGQTEGPKLVTSLLRYYSGNFLGYFLAMAGFFDRVARYGLIEGFSGYNLGIWTWSIMVLVG